ncbi:MAG: nucleotidyltransferase domain-containing protein [Chloroflexi bacterium]|nr:nucleotidyltransferase domain-containing protein [Chloroflexota bacterium]
MSQAQAKPAKRNKRARVIAETKIKYRVARAPKPPDPIIATELPRAVERIAYLAVSRQLRPRVFPVDIIVKTPKELEDDLSSGDFFVEEIFTKGRVLYERNH